MADLGSLVVRISLNNSQFSQGVVRVISDTQKLDRSVKQSSGMMQAAMTGAFTAISTSAINLSKRLATSALDFGKWGLKLAAEAEQAQVAFKTILGSSSVAEQTLKKLRTFANTTPFEFPEIRDAAKQLAAFGVEADDITPSLRRLGDISAGLGIPLGDLAYLYGTTRVQGRLFAADLNQFTSRGIPLIQELAKQFGVSDAQVKKLVESGKVGFPEVEKAIRAMTEEGGRFNNLTAAQASTLSGRYSTLGDSIATVAETAGARISEALNLKGVLTQTTELIDAIGTGLPGAFDAMQAAGVSAFTAIGNSIDAAGSKVAGFAQKGFRGLQVLSSVARVGVNAASTKVMQDASDSLNANTSGVGTKWTALSSVGAQLVRAGADSLLTKGGKAAGDAANVAGGVKSVFDGGVVGKALTAAAQSAFGNKAPASGGDSAAAPTPIANLLGQFGGFGRFGAGLFSGMDQQDLHGMLPNKTQVGTTSALSVGSSEAFSLINQRNRPQERTSEQQLAELKRIASGIMKLVESGTGGLGLLVEQVSI